MRIFRASLLAYGVPLAAALGVRLVFLFPVLREPERALVTDSPTFLEIARILRVEHRFDHLQRVPGYFAWVAAVQSTLGEDLRILAILQVLLDLGATAAVAALAGAAAGRRSALAGGLLYALNGVTPLASCRVLVDSLAVFLLSLSFLELRPGRGIRGAAASGVCLGLAAYVRPTALHLPLAVLPAFLAWPGGTRERTRAAATYSCAFLLAVLPWYARNRLVFGSWIFTSLGHANLLMGYGASAVSVRDGITYEQAQMRLLARLQEEGIAPADETHPWGTRIESAVLDDPALARAAGGVGLRVVWECRGAFVRAWLSSTLLLPLRLAHPGLGDLQAHLAPAYRHGPPDMRGDDASPVHLLKTGRFREGIGALASRVGGPGEARLWISLATFATSLAIVSGSLLALPSAARGSGGPERFALLASGCAGAVLVLTAIPAGATRYYAPALPPLCACAGAGWAAALSWIAERRGTRIPHDRPSAGAQAPDGGSRTP
ncbi:MAG: glycosyltransferase family 39 protein [Planctomycetes bacterium]|nr:glycosyltransferase family 39 protein [Planctomycetota bacterium]